MRSFNPWDYERPRPGRRDACLLWLDESGLLMAPLVRRSWAPQGQPSLLPQKAAHREKVSVAAALWLNPLRNRIGLAIAARRRGP